MAKQQGPAVIEVLRMNINQFERAVERKDGATAKRCIDAAEMMFRGLRDTAEGQGCAVGTCPAEPAPATGIGEPRVVDVPVADLLPPPAPAAATPGPSLYELETMLRRVLDADRAKLVLPPNAGFSARIARLERRDWGFGMLLWLTWMWVCCAACLIWAGVRRVFRRKAAGK